MTFEEYSKQLANELEAFAKRMDDRSRTMTFVAGFEGRSTLELQCLRDKIRNTSKLILREAGYSGYTKEGA